MRRFLAARVGPSGARVHLDRQGSHHLLGVLRAPRGTAVILFDGQGNEALGTLVDVIDDLAVLELSDLPAPARLDPLHLIIGLPRGPAMDAAVRMATEVGATHIHPFHAERSTARGDRADRWDRIAASAAQQCGRSSRPEVRPPGSLAGILDGLPDGLARFVAVPGADHLSARPGAGRPGGSALVIGPEGGLTPAELHRCLAAGAAPLGLGRWVLRVETAAAVGLSILAP